MANFGTFVMRPKEDTARDKLIPRKLPGPRGWIIIEMDTDHTAGRPRVQVRRAHLTDYAAVMAIDPDIFDRMDYLPALYTTLIRDRRFRGYIAEVDHQVVAFTAEYVMEDQGYRMGVSARIKPDYRGTGVFRVLGEAAEEDVRRHCKPLLSVWTATDKPAIFTEKYWRSPARTVIYKMALLCYIVPRGRVQKAVCPGTIPPGVAAVQVRELGPDEAFSVMSSDKTRRTLLRHPYLLALENYLPLKNCPRNMRLIAAKSKVFASFKENSSDARAISYSTMITAPVGVCSGINLHMYEHVDVLLAHLVKHLEHIAAHVLPDAHVGIRIKFPADMDKEKVKRFLYPAFGATKVNKVHPEEYSLVATTAPVEVRSNL